jgi:hypothetical protein
MSNIDFDNGFICGMATKGLVRSGELYKPHIWNDEGVYTYFYIDFRRAMEPFSTGMWNESIVIHDSEQIKATGIAFVSTGVYKIFCDISDRPHGITVLNKKVSRLAFSSGERLPVFSIHMFIAGQPAYIDLAYKYDNTDFSPFDDFEVTETVSSLEMFDFIVINEVSESATFDLSLSSVSETPGLVLT